VIENGQPRARRVALVTGAGQGIGKGVALRLAADGLAIALLDVDGDAARRTHAEIVAQGGCGVAVQADIGSAEQVAGALAAVEAELGPVDVLANVAGIYGRHALLHEQDLDNWNRVIGVNLTGTFLCTRGVVGGMAERGWGRIITFASGLAFRGRPTKAPYSASKAAIIAFTKSLALEVARRGVTANIVVPGTADTAMGWSDGADSVHQQIHANPVGRLGQPADSAAVVAFLASDDAAYITGQAIAVNGGSRMLP
jgi:NAD(P)-dependent dehydrogenase (short-subunit alcohol dehydrogenase family)